MTTSAARVLQPQSAEPARPAPPPRAAALPPAGASPAGDLQRRVSEAALLGFYRESRPAPLLSRGKLALTVASGIGGWAAVFGLGRLILG